MTAPARKQKATRAPKRRAGGDWFNREFSWLAFDGRVLEEALDPKNPLLERLRFLTIFHTNMDEFFMIRVSGLKQQIVAGVDALSLDGLSARAQLNRIAAILPPMLKQAQDCLHDDLLPALERDAGIRIVRYKSLSRSVRADCDQWFLRKVHPILTPLAVGPTTPFPFISNLSLNLACWVRAGDGERRLARLKVPNQLPQLIGISHRGIVTDLEAPIDVLPLEDLIAANIDTLFPQMHVDTPMVFRVTRDADLEIREDEAYDLRAALQEELRNRRFGRAMRLEVDHEMPEGVRAALRRGLQLEAADVYEVDGMLGVNRLGQLVSLDEPALKYPPFVATERRGLTRQEIFRTIRSGDVLLHHPFDAFSPVVDFLEEAAADPAVVAIKQTLYRTNGDSPIVRALENAVGKNKQVAVVVELKARFDEENNITWAQRLEEAGVHVSYGVPGLKVHCKLALVVRAERDELRRYAHIGTGNYNPSTARVYTDLGLLTADTDITADVADIFNTLTGFSNPASYRKLLVAPDFMMQGLIDRIDREAEHARQGRPAGLIFKINAITQYQVAQALYEASRAGVPIHLLVRGTCCLVPGLEDVSERITVRSVVGRFLEHSRVYWFENGGHPEALIGSADVMDRNLKARVEVLCPVEDPDQRHWLRHTLLQRYLDDTARTRQLQSDGTYRRLRSGRADELDAQAAFLADLKR